MVVLFSTQIKDNIRVLWWIKTILGYITEKTCCKKIDVNAVPNNVESVCNALDFKLGQSWEMYVSELPKMQWTTIFLTSVELDGLVVIFWVLSHAIHNGPNTLKSKDFSNQQAEMECPEQVVRKDEEAMEIDCY